MAHKHPGYKFENDWPYEEMKNDLEHVAAANVLSINVEIKAEHTVPNLDKVKEYIKNAEKVSLMDCSCRMKRGHCDAPIQVCLGLNGWADKFVNDKAFQYRHPHMVEKEEAIKILEKTADAGLVHMAYVYTDNLNPKGPDSICSCCSCCCEILGATLRYGIAPHVLKASAKSVRDESKCVNCGTCVDRCHFGAREKVNGSLVYNSDKCFGCGLCVETCPGKAITLKQLG